MPTKLPNIAKNIPIPEFVERIPRSSFGFQIMEVGDSVFREGDRSPKSEATKLRVAASIYKRNNKGWDYRSMTVTEKGRTGTRLWRIS
jgi:hypothetical protein